ncbi:uncharacterized protein [Temnothorax nylanderi]|uniref:uncharacterized protein n=1 Tax=Temnothorax nylanderi TaxID=102681 RepID=UPI003A88B2C3
MNVYAYKYYLWHHDCLKIINKRKIEKRKRIVAALLIILLENEQYKQVYSKKRFWVNPLLEERKRHGFYHSLFPIISLDSSIFLNYFRMTRVQFEELLIMVGPIISKQNLCREPISAAERLSLTLRYLVSGDSMTSLHYQYLIGLTTVTNIISETCQAIWNCLQPEVLPSNIDKNGWLRIAKEFEDLWNFRLRLNHCIGAIDGKHIVIQCPANAGSSYYNYKNCHSIVLLAICDAKYRFTFVDIGAYGRRSDGGIFRDSLIGQKFINKEMNLPEWEPLSFEGVDMPYVLIGDEAFPLSEYLMRPYPGKSLNEDRIIYNYRLSRARRIIENTFGILSSQWRILRRHIDCKMDKTTKLIQALVCLHNWLRINYEDSEYLLETMVDRDGPEGFIPGSWRQDLSNYSALVDITRCSTNNSSRTAIKIRNKFCHYFNSEGAVPWQFDQC